MLLSKVQNAAFQMKYGKDHSYDGINIQLVIAGGHEIWKGLGARFSPELSENAIRSC